MSPSKNIDPSPQFFQFLSTGFDVTKALEIVSTRTEPDGEIEVQLWANQYLQPDPNESDKLRALCLSVNWDHVPTVDLDTPLIMAWFEGRSQSGRIIIDGYHRLAKARREGIEKLPVYVLSKEESAKVRVG